jgi:uncharacterized protein (DUF849 family)
MSPYLPVTPKQIADEAVRAWEAGAAVAHVHVRDPETGRPASSLDLFQEVITEIKARCNIVICVTTGGGFGMTVEQRVAPVPAFKPELASLNFGSLNIALFPTVSQYKEFKFPWEPEFLSLSEDNIFPNTFKTLREFCKFFKESETKPELEIYDVGMINNLAFMIQQGHLEKPVYLQFVMGILGGISPTMENLMFLYQTARRAIGDFLEDSLYLEKGRMAKSNAEQVEKIIRIAREFGIDPATPDEAREILGLKGLDRVNF